MNRILLVILASLPLAAFAESNGTAPAPAPAPGPAPVQTAPGATATAPETAHAPEVQQAQGTQAQQPKSQDPFGGMGFLLIMAVPLALMWFMASRSQKREEKKKQELLSAIKRGDQVVTIGGAHGEVAAVGEATVDVRLGKGDDAAVVTFNKTAIASVAGLDAGKAK